jgi:Carboxypeptidase regulatory-like domain
MRLWATLAVLVLSLMACLAVADEIERSSTLNFQVLRDYNGKPVQNASVILHPVDRRGRQGKGGYQLKTDAEGKTSFEGVPYGKLRVQVLAPGFQTFGEDYDVNQPTTAITIKLKRPQGQYSIYENKK